MTKNLTISLLFLLLSSYAYSELYTALADLEGLLQTETALLTTIEHYIHAQEQKLILLKKYHEFYQNQHAKAEEGVQPYLENPINAFLLVKRLTTDWKQVESLLSKNVGEEFLTNLSQYRDILKFPSDEDLNGAAVALTRLQDTYRLDTSSLASGEINGIKYTSELTAADCFELGRQSYNNEDYYHTQLWMAEADERLRGEPNQTVERSDVLEYLAYSTFKLGNMVLALELTNKLLELTPTHQRALQCKAYYEKEISKSVTVQKIEEEKEGKEEEEEEEKDDMQQIETYAQIKKLYEKLCRGDVGTPEAILTKLRCRYVDNNNPFLKIGPFKVEEAYTTPRIVVFHDVMSDDEITTIKQLARPRFKRATVQNAKTGELETSKYRISKSAWLKEIEHEHIATVVQRVEDMTGLTMETAEELQVVNYGIGGHYEPHFDFARKGETNAFKGMGTGNRIATVLFYMSDVSQGGATVFPYIKTALRPKKGTAVLWYNLHASGEGDKMTRHAACPVLAGSKWVSNKWIHEVGQEFRRPCDLTRPPLELTA